VLRRIGVALVVQEPVARVEVGRNRSWQVSVDALHSVDALGIVGVAVDQHGVPMVPENLVSNAMVKTPLQLDLHTVEASVAGRRIQGDVPVSLLVVGPGCHIGK